MKKYILFSLVSIFQLIFFVKTCFSETVNLTENLAYKNFIEFYFSATHSNFLKEEKQFAIKRYLSHDSIIKYSTEFQSNLSSFIRSPNFLNAITYLNFKWDKKDSKKHIQNLIALYYFEKRLALTEIAHDPRYNHIKINHRENIAERVKQWLQESGDIYSFVDQLKRATSCIVNLQETPLIRAKLIKNCLEDNFPKLNPMKGRRKISFAEIDLGKEIPHYPGFVISRTGFIQGNKIAVLNENRKSWDDGYLATLETYHNNIVERYENRWAPLSDEEMIEEMLQIIKDNPDKNPIYEIFSDGEIVDAFHVDKNEIWKSYVSEGNMALNRKKQTFTVLLEKIRSAKSTIFINIFFWGGTMGIALTNEIINLLQQKPDLKFIFIHDTVNHFGHRAEMSPVFNFLRAYMILHPDRILAVPSFVLKNVTGFPPFVDKLVTEELLQKMGLDEKMSIYIKAKSDHSKVIVIDGDDLQGNPVAYVGSKNLTDSSGAICNDEGFLVEGPAAVVILDNYWKDLYDALKYDWRSKKYMEPYYEEIYEYGWGKTYGEVKARFKKIKNMLAPLDILKRYERNTEEELHGKILEVKTRSKGTEAVRIGENSVGSFITSCISQNIHTILFAEKQILINDQLLYDPRIIRILAKKRRDGVDVKVILEGFIHEGSAFPGMPNLLYLKYMKENGIEVKWKLHARSDVFIPEHHGKTLSIDGFTPDGNKIDSNFSSLILGSANKDYMTMKGAFRETQLEVFSEESQRIHDMLFWQNWNDEIQGTKDASFEEFRNSTYGKKIEEKNIPIDSFLNFVRGFVEMLYTLKVIDR